MELTQTKDRLVKVIENLYKQKKAILNKLKEENSGLERDDFIWHYLLQSFATMGKANGKIGLIDNQTNYNKVSYENIKKILPEQRQSKIEEVCRSAKVRMPQKKATFILECFLRIEELGGLESAKEQLLSLPGKEMKILFLKSFHGIGDKYARNIMMDVYHEDFRNSIAVDTRIKSFSKFINLSFKNYKEEEQFYLQVAKEANINGWELDRILFNFNDEVKKLFKEFQI